MIERRRAWKEVAQQRWRKSGSNNSFGSILSRRHKDITDQTVIDLHNLADLLLDTPHEFKLIVSANQAHVYTNHVDLIDQLSDLDILCQKEYSRAVITRPRDTIQLKNPRYQYRSYFRSAKLTDQQKDHLVNFLINQQSHARISPALSGWTVAPFHRTQEYFFVDHDNMTWLTMLALVRPGLIRKTMQIISAK
jgi:hypothetical protein